MVRKAFLVAAAIAFGLTDANAQEPFWTALRGPFRGVVSCMSSTQAGSLLVGINQAEGNFVYRSSDRGDSWTQVAQATAWCFGIDSVLGLIYMGTDPVFVGGSSLYCSSDDGISWVPMASTQSYVMSVVVTSPGHLLLGTYSGIYRSDDSGKHLTTVHSASGDHAICSLAFAPWGDLLIGTYLAGVFSSPDSGVTWNPIGPSGIRWAYPILAASPGNIYFGSNTGLYISTNRGGGFTQSALTTGGVHAAAFDKQGVLYCGKEGDAYYTLNPDLGIRSSTDLGQTWQDRDLKRHSVKSIVFDTSENIYAGTDAGVHRSRDHGISWEFIGISGMPIWALASFSDSTLYAGDDMDGGIYRSTDLGRAWERLAWGLCNGQIQDIAVNSQGDLFASAIGYPTRACRRSHQTDEWEVLFAGEPINQFSFDKDGHGFAASLRNEGAIGGVFQSTDNGASWGRNVTSDFDVYSIAVSNPYVFAGTANGFYRSTDLGLSWEHPNGDLNATDLRFVVIDTNETRPSFGWVIAGTRSSGVFRSTDHGIVWMQMNYGMRGKTLLNLVNSAWGDLLAITDSGAFHAVADGNEWTALPWDFSQPRYAVTITSDRRVILAPYGSPIQISQLQLTGITPVCANSFLPPQLVQNYPNPFNSTTVVGYQLPAASDVRLVVYDILGRQVSVLVNQRNDPGYHEVRFDGSGLASGMYIYRLTAGSYTQTRKLLLLR